METEEIQKILSEISKQFKESEKLRKELRELNKMVHDMLVERIDKLESVMQEFCNEADEQMMNPWAGVYYKKFKELLEEK